MRVHPSFPALVLAFAACRPANDWPAHRHDGFRSANQPRRSALSDTARVQHLHELWSWQPSLVGDPNVGGTGYGFSASPVVVHGVTYVGHLNGFFYAIDAAGHMKWKFPSPPAPPLIQSLGGNPSSPGIASTAWAGVRIQGHEAVLFGAPDPSSSSGDGRVWALRMSDGALLWRSPVIAQSSNNEQIGYDSPLVVGDRIYIGISNHGDDPIIAGKVFALDLNTGALVSGFTTFVASTIRGGGVWSSPVATPDGDLIITTGNSCYPADGGCMTEPSNDYALSMVRLDPASGTMIWQFQAVPWTLDADADWSGIPAIARTTCGTLAVGTQKDGYTHALDAGPRPGPGSPATLGLAARRWTFPPATIPFTSGYHGDDRYIRGTATWRDVAFAVTGGPDVTTNVTGGYNRLYAIDVCASDAERIRWWIELPGFSYPTLGSPSVTHGVAFIGTATDTLYAIADTTVAPSTGTQCDQPGVPVAFCVSSGFRLTPIPRVLARVPLSGSIRTTPALAHGRVYVTSDDGVLHVLAP